MQETIGFITEHKQLIINALLLAGLVVTATLAWRNRQDIDKLDAKLLEVLESHNGLDQAVFQLDLDMKGVRLHLETTNESK